MNAQLKPATSQPQPRGAASAALPAAPAASRDKAGVLTHTGGTFEISVNAQGLLCFLDNDELLILHGKRLDPLVQEFEHRLKQQRRTYRHDFVDLAELKQLYSRTTVEKTIAVQSDSANQAEVKRLIDEAVRLNASDMHFYINRDIGEIRYRVNGLLESFKGGQKEPAEVQALIATIYNSMLEVGGNATYFQQNTPQDGRIRQEFLDRNHLSGVRCATRPKDKGSLGIFRLLYAHRGIKALDKLGYLPEQIATWTSLMRRKVGMNILSGPTGSGKSTTLSTIYGMQVEYFDGKLHVLTVEDPVEYEIPGVNHTNVDRDTDNNPDWPKSIKNLMRLDPDIAGIGEMRDHESATAAFMLATTGHSTWSTLHANDAFAIVQRLTDLEVDPGLIYDPAVLTGMISQGLAPTVCPHCAVPWAQRPQNYDQSLVERVTRVISDTSKVRIAVGCDRCRQTGAAGRTVLAEVVETNLHIMRTLKKYGAAEARALWVREYAGITKTAHLIRRIQEGLIDPAHAEASIGPLDEDARTLDIEE